MVDFGSGSTTLGTQADDTLDNAARLFRAGNPVVMTVAGHSDQMGAEFPNLLLSARRAAAVKSGLVDRGIPADRLALQALGESDPADASHPDSAANRRVVITWR